MIFFLDFRNDVAAFAAVGARDARWAAVRGGASAGAALAKASRAFGMPSKKPAAIVVAMGGEAGKRDASWSTVRAAVAAANALAFAWGIPAAPLSVRGDETRPELEVGVREAAKDARPGRWVSARYNGEPTITKAKPVL